MLVTPAGRTIDVTQAAADLLHRARGDASRAGADAVALPPCPAAWAALCKHLHRCGGSPYCPGAAAFGSGPSGYPESTEHAAGARANGAVAPNVTITLMLAATTPAVFAPLRAQLTPESGLVCADAIGVDGWQRAAHRWREIPDVLVIDAALCDGGSLGAVAAWRARKPSLRVVVLADTTGDAGAMIVQQRWHGLLLPHCLPEVGVRAIRAVLRGELWLPRAMLAQLLAARPHESSTTPLDAPASDGELTDRQSQIVAHLRQGFTNKEIANRMGIKEDTVKKHLQAVFGKLGVRRRALVALGGVARLPNAVDAKKAALWGLSMLLDAHDSLSSLLSTITPL
ncbi:MAG TPA: response regulator transcription factor [Burkholderiaceae bacterium]|nr:response regulator transcription factor [Burkholderiaceae bacterium]